MKNLKQGLSLLLAVMILALSFPMEIFAESDRYYEGIDLTVLVDADSYFVNEYSATDDELLVALLTDFFNQFKRGNPKNKINLVILSKFDYFHELQSNNLLASDFYSGLSSKKFVLGGEHGNRYSDFGDCLKYVNRVVDPKRKPVVLSISNTGGIEYMTFAYFEREEILGGDYHSRRDYLDKIMDKLDRTLGYNSGRIRDTKDLSHTLSITHDLHAIQIDTKSFDYDFGILSPYITKNVPGSEQELRQNLVDLYGLFPYPYQPDNLEMEFQQLVYVQSMCSEYYGDEMMKALGKTSYHKIQSFQDLKNQLNQLNDQMKATYHSEQKQEPFKYTLKPEDTWSFKNTIFNGISAKKKLPYQDKMKYKSKFWTKINANDGSAGNCFGMSMTVALHKMGLLNNEDFELKNNSGVPLKNSDPLSYANISTALPLIHLYSSHQLFINFFHMFGKNPELKNENRKILSLAEEVEKMKDGGPPVLITYEEKATTLDDKGKKTHRRHSILAHNIRRAPGKDGTIYIDIYDPNWPGNVRNEALIIEPSLTKRGQVYFELNASIPINSDTGTIKYFSTGDDIIKALNVFRTGEPKNVAYITLPRNQGSLTLVENGTKRYQINSDEMSAIGLDTIPGSVDADSIPLDFSVVLPNTNSMYELINEHGEQVECIVDLPNQGYYVKADALKSIKFNPEGLLEVKGGQGQVEACVLRDEKVGQEELGYLVQGQLNGDLTLHQTSQGLELNGNVQNGKIVVPDLKEDRLLKQGNLTSGVTQSGKNQHEKFKDIYEDDWYFDAVNYVYKEKLMKGMSEHRFEPRGNFTRAQMAQIIYNIAGQPRTSAKSQFVDVSTGDWHHDAVSWVASKGWIHGYGDGKYGPNDPIRRQDVAVIFHNIVYNMPAKNPNALNIYGDRMDVSSYAKGAMTWAVDDGIFKGDAQGKLNPRGNITRAEMAQVLKNLKMESKPEN